MSDEGRLKDAPDLPRGLAEALDAGRDDLPSEAEVQALEASVLAALSGGGGGGGPSGGEGAAQAAKAANAVQLSLAGGVLATVALVAVWTATRPAEVPERVVHEDARVASEDAGVDAAEIDGGSDAGRDAGIDAPIDGGVRVRALRIDAGLPEGPAVEIVEPRTVEEARVIDELALLRAARSALSRDPAEALALTERMGAVPSPAWAEERERVAIEALHALGRSAEARGRFERFVERFPASAYRERLQAILDRP